MGCSGGLGSEAEGILGLKGLCRLIFGDTRVLWVLGSGGPRGSCGPKDTGSLRTGTGSLRTGILCRTEGLKLGRSPELQVPPGIHRGLTSLESTKSEET